jgi:hypothetical protein
LGINSGWEVVLISDEIPETVKTLEGCELPAPLTWHSLSLLLQAKRRTWGVCVIRALVSRTWFGSPSAATTLPTMTVCSHTLTTVLQCISCTFIVASGGKRRHGSEPESEKPVKKTKGKKGRKKTKEEKIEKKKKTEE